MRRFYETALQSMIGESSSRAVTICLGAESFVNPYLLVKNLRRIFGHSTLQILEHLVTIAKEMEASER